MKKYWWIFLLLFLSLACATTAPKPGDPEKPHMIWVKVMKAEVKISGDCSSFDKGYPSRYEERTFTLKEARAKKGNIDILCDVPNRKTTVLDKQYSVVIKYRNGASERIGMNDQSNIWLSLPLGRWCKMNDETKQINIKNCRSVKP